LSAVLETLVAPTLILAGPDELPQIAEQLPPQHDVCLRDAAPQLVRHRLTRLAGQLRGHKDPLTGLLGRDRFLTILKNRLQEATAERPFSLLMLDIDRFKIVNDECGHAIGDAVLTEMAARLRAISPARAVLARYGGEELLVGIQATEEDALTLAETIRSNVETCPFLCEHALPIRVSLGLATTTARIRPREILQQTEEAIYAAKAAGRNQVVHYRAMERRAMSQDVDVALQSFENMTRVVSERMAEAIARRGRQIYRAIKQQADVDALTGLYSRRYLERRLTYDFQTSRATGRALCVALLDIDYFGRVNKRFGWPAGDHVLREISDCVVAHVRRDDWVARYGGEELCLVMRDVTIKEGRQILERIRQTVESTSFKSPQGAVVHVTVSVGAAEMVQEDADLPSLLDRVSDQLLVAKRSGRNQTCA
jgi:two-component system cell cycle response regulator